MQENVVSVLFEQESEAYQAFSEFKMNPFTNDYTVPQASIIRKENGQIVVKDAYNVNPDSYDDQGAGGLIGSILGIFGGPLGVLFGFGLGSSIGAAQDISDTEENESMLETMAKNIKEGQTALVFLAQENRDGAIAQALSKYKVEITKEDAGEVAAEVKEAAKVQADMEKEARKKLRESKKADFAGKVKAEEDRIKSKFEELRNKHAKA